MSSLSKLIYNSTNENNNNNQNEATNATTTTTRTTSLKHENVTLPSILLNRITKPGTSSIITSTDESKPSIIKSEQQQLQKQKQKQKIQFEPKQESKPSFSQQYDFLQNSQERIFYSSQPSRHSNSRKRKSSSYNNRITRIIGTTNNTKLKPLQTFDNYNFIYDPIKPIKRARNERGHIIRLNPQQILERDLRAKEKKKIYTRFKYEKVFDFRKEKDYDHFVTSNTFHNNNNNNNNNNDDDDCNHSNFNDNNYDDDNNNTDEKDHQWETSIEYMIRILKRKYDADADAEKQQNSTNASYNSKNINNNHHHDYNDNDNDDDDSHSYTSEEDESKINILGSLRDRANTHKNKHTFNPHHSNTNIDTDDDDDDESQSIPEGNFSFLNYGHEAPPPKKMKHSYGSYGHKRENFYIQPNQFYIQHYHDTVHKFKSIMDRKNIKLKNPNPKMPTTILTTLQSKQYSTIIPQYKLIPRKQNGMFDGKSLPFSRYNPSIKRFQQPIFIDAYHYLPTSATSTSSSCMYPHFQRRKNTADDHPFPWLLEKREMDSISLYRPQYFFHNPIYGFQDTKKVIDEREGHSFEPHFFHSRNVIRLVPRLIMGWNPHNSFHTITGCCKTKDMMPRMLTLLHKWCNRFHYDSSNKHLIIRRAFEISSNYCFYITIRDDLQTLKDFDWITDVDYRFILRELCTTKGLLLDKEPTMYHWRNYIPHKNFAGRGQTIRENIYSFLQKKIKNMNDRNNRNNAKKINVDGRKETHLFTQDNQVFKMRPVLGNDNNRNDNDGSDTNISTQGHQGLREMKPISESQLFNDEEMTPIRENETTNDRNDDESQRSNDEFRPTTSSTNSIVSTSLSTSKDCSSNAITQISYDDDDNHSSADDSSISSVNSNSSKSSKKPYLNTNVPYKSNYSLNFCEKAITNLDKIRDLDLDAKFSMVRHESLIDPTVVMLTVVSLCSELYYHKKKSFANLNNRKKWMDALKREDGIHNLLISYFDNTLKHIAKLDDDDSVGTRILHAYTFNSALVSTIFLHQSFIANSGVYHSAKDTDTLLTTYSSSVEYESSDEDYDSDNSYKGNFMKESCSGKILNPMTNFSEVATVLARLGESRLDDPKLKIFPNIHITTSIAILAACLPPYASEIISRSFYFRSDGCNFSNESNYSSPFVLVQLVLEEMERRSDIISKKNAFYDLWGDDVSSNNGSKIDYVDLITAFHESAGIFLRQMEYDPSNVLCFTWYVAMLVGAFCVGSGIKIGNGLQLAAPPVHIFDAMGDSSSHSRWNYPRHVDYKTMRSSTCKAVTDLLQFKEQNHQYHIFLSTFLEWKEAIFLLTYRPYHNPSSFRKIRQLHASHFTKWALADCDKTLLDDFICLAEKGDVSRDVVLSALATMVENEPDNIQYWSNLACALGNVAESRNDGKRKKSSWWGKTPSLWWDSHFFHLSSYNISDHFESHLRKIVKKARKKLKSKFIELSHSLNLDDDGIKLGSDLVQDASWLWPLEPTEVDEEDHADGITNNDIPDNFQEESFKESLPQRHLPGINYLPMPTPLHGRNIISCALIACKVIVASFLYGENCLYVRKVVSDLCYKSMTEESLVDTSSDEFAALTWLFGMGLNPKTILGSPPKYKRTLVDRKFEYKFSAMEF